MKRRLFLTLPALLLIGIDDSSANYHIKDIACAAINLGFPRKFKQIRLREAEIKIKIQDDFKNNKVFEVQGWLLSETEIQMCVNEYLKSI